MALFDRLAAPMRRDMHHPSALLAPVALLLLAAAPAQPPDPVRDRIIADASGQSPASLAFERTSHIIQVGGGTRSEVLRIDRWDGHGWQVISVNGKPPSPTDLKDLAKPSNQQVPGYFNLARLLATSTERSTDPEGNVVLTIPQLPPRSIVNDGTDISSFLRAEAVIDNGNGKPWVRKLRLTARQPFKLSWLLKVLTFNQISEYKLDTSGKPRLTSQVADSQGTLLGIAGGQTSEVTYAYR